MRSRCTFAMVSTVDDEKDEKDDIRDEISWCPYAELAARIRSKGVV